MIRCREFITLLGGAVAWPLAAQAQQPAMPAIGYLGTQFADGEIYTVPFFRGLKEAGYVEDQNVAVEYRWAENQIDRLPALAADLVRRRVAVIVAHGAEAAQAAKAATTTIPIVFTAAPDPVAFGLVASLNRPGANLTGIVTIATELSPKRLQLLRDLIPNAVAFGVLLGGPDPLITDLQAAARTLGAQLVVAKARTTSDLETAFATFSQHPVSAVMVGLGFFTRHMEQLAALATRHALPTRPRQFPLSSLAAIQSNWVLSRASPVQAATSPVLPP
jgi:putative ABC transport system substrate-binding protein